MENVTVTSTSPRGATSTAASRTGLPAARARACASSMSRPWLAATGSNLGPGLAAGAAPATMIRFPQTHRIE
ncbi:MAG TPA: hypothetical protein VFI16_02020 [Anaeromyxobacteraceae bacterium]|nr:hypothetical protein [Anaeromyxobacteraceae bacterium]